MLPANSQPRNSQFPTDSALLGVGTVGVGS
jgi:hypothetical protein